MLAARLEACAPREKWWPYDDPFEIAVSAVLTQRTTWASAEKAMGGLRAAGLLTAPAMARAPPSRVEALVRGTGFYRQKARAIRQMAGTLVDHYGGRIENAFKLPTGKLRRELLSWRGVGDETADAILLYAARRPVFVVDAYALRIMRRFGALDLAASPSYGDVADAWRQAGVETRRAADRAHAALVQVGKTHCRTVPACRGCPLRAPCLRAGVPIR